LASEAPNRQVFINCPFSADYRTLFEAIVFATILCGFKARCALENDDGGEVRVAKVMKIIRDCGYGVHDISFMGLDDQTKLARLNMAFELGLFLGARRYGGRRTREKTALILDREQYRYQKSLSDIAGQDIRAHGDRPERAIGHVRDWLQTCAAEDDMPGGDNIVARYAQFRGDLPDLCRVLNLTPDKLTFVDLTKLIARWLKQNA
jgi:hypothetical protein